MSNLFADKYALRLILCNIRPDKIERKTALNFVEKKSLLHIFHYFQKNIFRKYPHLGKYLRTRKNRVKSVVLEFTCLKLLRLGVRFSNSQGVVSKCKSKIVLNGSVFCKGSFYPCRCAPPGKRYSILFNMQYILKKICTFY